MTVQPLLLLLYILKIRLTTATSYSIIRKWIVKDACNNTSEFIQAVNVAVVRTDIAVTEIKSYNIDDIPAPTINLFSLPQVLNRWNLV
jgi:hypothetical protein